MSDRDITAESPKLPMADSDVPKDWWTAYDLKGKKAIVTGAGSGLNYALTVMLLEAGCSVMMADLKLRDENKEILARYEKKEDPTIAHVAFFETDVCNWSQLTAMWNKTLETFGQVDLVVNGAGIYEPPFSSFWNPPGSLGALDESDAQVGAFRTFSVNAIAPIRLAQMAIHYWLEHPEIQANLLWIASLGGYVHSAQTPIYYASKSPAVSMTKSFKPFREVLGIRNAAICPGLVRTPIFSPDYCKDRVREEDLAMTSEECAGKIMEVIQEKKWGDGNIVELLKTGPLATDINVRDVPLCALYPAQGPVGEDNHLVEEEMKFLNALKARRGR